MDKRSIADLIGKKNDIAHWLEWWLDEPRLTPENQITFEKYYSSYKKAFPLYVKKYYAKQTEDMMRLIGRMGSPRILEVGCGCGTESLWFAAMGAKVLGVDLSDARLAVARERCEYIGKHLSGFDEESARFENVSLFNLSSKKKFDIVWMEQAYHHVEPRLDVPGKLKDLLVPGGYVVISEANGWNPVLQLQLLKKRGFKTIRTFKDSNGQIHPYGNERITLPGAVARLFKKSGFHVEAVNSFRIFPNMSHVDSFSWFEKLIPENLLPAYTHFNIVLKKS